MAIEMLKMGSPAPPAGEAVRSELARLIADKRFAHSPTLIRFLQFTVSEALAGRCDQLKEILLGREVFDRGPDFDPRIDPIVRVQAGKLRAKLADYYKSRGASDPFRIEFPKGSYSPQFVTSPPVEAPVVEPLTPPCGPSATATPAQSETPSRRPWILATAGVALAVAGAWLWFHSRSAPEPKLTLVQLTFEAGSAMNPAISSDGKLLAYSSDRGRGDLNIWIRPVHGGTPVQLTHDEAADHSPDFSPDGTLIAFHSYRQDGGIYAVSAFGGEERRIADNGWSPRFSPDGAWIAYLGSDQSLFAVPVAGGQPHRVAGGTIDALSGPIWTLDGTHLIFLGAPRSADNVVREYDWYSVPWTGGVPVPAGLREQLSAQGLPHPTPNARPGDWLGGAIVFSLQRGKAANIWKVPFNAKKLRVTGLAEQLTAGTAAETFPRCSTSGKMVLTSEEQLTHVFSLQLDARGEAVGPFVRLTSDSSLIDGRVYPRLTADGTSLSYVSNRSGTQELVLKDLARGAETSLGALPRQESQPLISGDESLLVYGDSDAQTVYAVERSKPYAERVCERCGRVLDWSPNGSKVLLEAPSRRALELWDRAAGRRFELMSYPIGTLQGATLSADQQWIAVVFSSPRGAFVAPLSVKPIPQNALISIQAGTDLASLGWSSDSKVLYFFSRLDDYRCLWGQRFDERARRPVGKPFSIQHFHSNRLAPWGSRISVGAGRMVFTLTEPRSNVWLATLGGALALPGSALR